MQLAARLVVTGLLPGPAACTGKTEHGAGPVAGVGAQPAAAPEPEPASAASSARPRRHLLLVLELEPAIRAARVLLAKPVELPLPRRRGPERAQPWRVEVRAGDGAVLFSAPLADATERRAEFPDLQTGELRGTTTHQAIAAVTLRLPELPGAEQVRLVDVAAGGIELGRVAYPQVAP